MNKNTTSSILIGLITLLLCFAIVAPAAAQSDNTLVLRLSRDFGFAGGSGQIQGTFTMHVTGPANLAQVDFLIDGKSIGKVAQAPFNLQFNTGNYPLGAHKLSAVGLTSDGQELRSPEVTVEFVSPETGMQAAGRIAIPILVIVLAAVLVSTIIPALGGRGKHSQLAPGTPRNYGLKGGGICPKCGRPFSFSVLSINLPFVRFDRCPFCGHRGFIKIASMDDLRKAEAAELKAAGTSQAIPEESEEEKLRKELDDSRYQGL
jgi:DNA-directed RNA polymerase subunit RPC12/RpoP